MVELISSAGSVLGLVALLVAAIAVAYSALTRTTITTLKESNAALTERVALLEKSIALDVAVKAALTAERDAALTERDAIAKVVTGEVHLVAIENALSEHHKDATGWWTTLSADLHGVRVALEAIVP